MSYKKNIICAVPFVSFEIHERSNFLCCPSWMTKHLPEGLGVRESFTCKEAREVRDSILDGSYKYCDENQCPFLIDASKGISPVKPLYHKNADNFPLDLKNAIDSHNKNEEWIPRTMQFAFDRSCNLKCPSCRIEIIVANSKKIESVKATIDEIEHEYSKGIKTLYITGSGDPFISVGFRDFLRTLNPKKYPILENIHLHTNATKWDRKMWESMKVSHPYIKSCEISIDAGTKETYEKKTRLGGNWDELIDNLKFIATIPTLERIKTSFVVQKHNYKEMKIFYDLMISIFGKKVNVFYGRINNWGTFTDEEFKEHQVWDENNPLYNDFVKEVNKTLPAVQSFHNLHEFLMKKSVI